MKASRLKLIWSKSDAPTGCVYYRNAGFRGRTPGHF